MRTLTTSLIIIHPHRPELLCIRHPQFGVWMFPGGRVEPGEAPHVSAMREASEEVGLEVTLKDMSTLPPWSSLGNTRLPQPLAMIEELVPQADGEDHFFIDLVYVGVATCPDFELRGEVSEACWLKRDALDALTTSFPIKEMAGHIFESMRQLR